MEMIASFSDKSTRIAFTNFKDVPHDFFLLPINKIFLNNSKKYRLVTCYNPHIQLFSVFGKKSKVTNSNADCKIFFSGENTNFFRKGEYKGNCIDYVSQSFGFDFSTADNYLRFPLWLLYYFTPDNNKEEICEILNKFNQKYKKTKFCSLVASHDKNGIRTKIYNAVSRIGRVDCPGKLLHNDDTLHNQFSNDKSLYLQQYKFNICPENSNSPGYVTEKIFQSLYSGCIPIYNGWNKDPEPGILNPKIILWFNEPDLENKNLMDEVEKLNSNDNFYSEFISQPVFCDTAAEKIFYMLSEFKNKIYSSIDKYIIRTSLKTSV